MEDMIEAQAVDSNLGEQGFVSFRDKLLSTPTDMHSVKEGEVVISDLDGSSSDEDSSSDADSSSEDEGDDRLEIPVLEFSQEEYDQWCRLWKLTLLVRLMGKTVEGSKAPATDGGDHPNQDDGKGREDEMGKSEIYGPWMLLKKPNQRRNIAFRKSGVNANHGPKVNGGLVKGANLSRFGVLRDLDLNEDHHQAYFSGVNEKSMRESFVNPVFEGERSSGGSKNGVGLSGLGPSIPFKPIQPHVSILSGTMSYNDSVRHPSKPPDLNEEFMDVGGENIGDNIEDMHMHEVEDVAPATRSKTFLGLVRDLKHRHNIDFVALVETRQSGDKASEIIKKLGFDGLERVHAVGFVGGIWCLWRKDRVSVSVLLKHHQFMHLKVNKGGKDWLFMVVYGSPTHGGSSGGSRPDRGFWDWVGECDMIDLGFTGSRFTWSRKGVSIRLDRVLVSQSWKLMFLEATVVHLPCFKSDHNPLWIRFDPSTASTYRHDMSFRFLAAWVTHESFSNVVREAWKQGTSWHVGVKTIKHATAKDASFAAVKE
ncbi:RNA-directed DNA polymerase [Senna tora]|uniref:RNA-directed DNA polymerase n=1 Tax=Senna tora TaxID=362788 RepID=A0A834X6L3_9FABA|nr:RNA-directed DNA polymerase [Senna tora]